VIHVSRRRDRWLDIAIRATLVAIVGLTVYLGYAVWLNTRVQAVSSPAGRAVENLRKIVTASPGNANARVKLAEALAFAGRLDEAVEQFLAALKLEPDYIPALSGVASVSMQQKNFKVAESYWLKIVGLLDNTPTAAKNPQLDSAYYGLGVTYIELKRYEDAVGALKESLRITSSAADTHYQLSIAYGALGFLDQQREELEITLAFDPKNAQPNYDLGLVALKEGDIAAAAELFRAAADYVPEDITLPQQELLKIEAKGSAAVRLAKARSLASTEASAALSEARITAALDPKSVAAVRLVAQLWDKLGNKESALNAYRRIIELVPGDDEATQAIKRLNPDGK
jgi:tetratricopeptide (TPR) repeat protein